MLKRTLAGVLPQAKRARSTLASAAPAPPPNGAARTSFFLGAHLSMAGPGGFGAAVERAHKMGASALAFYLKNQKRWVSPALAEEEVQAFRQALAKCAFPLEKILPHGAYLINLANPDPAMVAKSRAAFLDELKRCERMGIPLFNFHVGSTVGKCSQEEGIERVADAINWALGQTSGVVWVLENSAGQGNTIGGTFAHLRDIIQRVEDKTRVGVCLDTCHLYSAGYDLVNNYDEVFQSFHETVGFLYLKAVHLNDSKASCGSLLDRHENIGKGKIGEEFFKKLMRDERFKNIPVILETPASSEETYEREIAQLYSFCAPQAQ